MQSKRQQRKSERASKKDKWGYPMSLSRRQRRSLRNQAMAASYMKGNVTTTLAIGEKMEHCESGFILHAGGTRKCY